MLVLGRDATPTIVAREASTLMLLGGEPVGARYIWWNFVSSRRERLEQAKADWNEGRIAQAGRRHGRVDPGAGRPDAGAALTA